MSSVGNGATDRSAHKRFLDQYYGWTRPVYDLTRKYYLFGRDTAIAELLREPWSKLIEVGPGTGRNLAMLRNRRKTAQYGGIEASTAMLEEAQRQCPWATLREGFAEDCDYGDVFGEAPDRIFFSYCLSMVQDADAALRNARSALPPHGQVVVVDFGDLKGLRGPLGPLLRQWLATFHVKPLPEGLLERHATTITEGPLRYYRIARCGPL